MLAALLVACARSSSGDTSVFPYTYTPQSDLEPYEEVRWETETWDPIEDFDLAMLYVEKSVEHRRSAPGEELDHYATMRDALPPLGAGTRVDFAGDVMWVGANWGGFLTPVAGLFPGDVAVANLETPVDATQPTDKASLDLYAFNAPPELLDGLPFDVLQLNNNHTMDMGNSGVDATLAEVDARGFVRTGVDAHARVGDVAFLSFTWGLNVRDLAPERELFVVPFGHLDEEVDLSSVATAIDGARSGGARSVVLLLHWGYEYEYYPDPHFMVLAREMIALGADVVVGEGPHVVQPPEICAVDQGVEADVGTCAIETGGAPRTAAVLYSLGNLGTTMATLPCQVGIVASVTLDQDVTGLGWTPAVSVAGADGPTVYPGEAYRSDPEVAAELDRLDAHLGTGWKLP